MYETINRNDAGVMKSVNYKAYRYYRFVGRRAGGNMIDKIIHGYDLTIRDYENKIAEITEYYYQLDNNISFMNHIKKLKIYSSKNSARQCIHSMLFCSKDRRIRLEVYKKVKIIHKYFTNKFKRD